MDDYRDKWMSLNQQAGAASSNHNELMTASWNSVTASDEDVHPGAMVALFIPADEAERLSVPSGEPASNMHCTIAILTDDASKIDNWDEIKDVLRDVATRHAELKGEISGTGTFVNGKSDVATALPDLPGLAELHADVVSSLEKIMDLTSDHGYSPHITIAYGEDDGDHPLKITEPIKLDIGEVSLMAAGERTDFPLTGAGSEWHVAALPEPVGTQVNWITQHEPDVYDPEVEQARQGKDHPDFPAGSWVEVLRSESGDELTPGQLGQVIPDQSYVGPVSDNALITIDIPGDGWVGVSPQNIKPIDQHESSWRKIADNPLLNTSGPLDAPANIWVYVNGSISFAQTMYDAARQAALDSGLDEQAAERIENILTRKRLPEEVKIAVGILNQRDRPVFWASNTDRNAVYDAVMADRLQELPNDYT